MGTGGCISPPSHWAVPKGQQRYGTGLDKSFAIVFAKLHGSPHAFGLRRNWFPGSSAEPPWGLLRVTRTPPKHAFICRTFAFFFLSQFQLTVGRFSLKYFFRAPPPTRQANGYGRPPSAMTETVVSAAIHSATMANVTFRNPSPGRRGDRGGV